jgi:hypothetical protein
MLGVSQALEARGHEVVLGGGGPGTRFIEENGYEVFRAAPVEFIRDYQFRPFSILQVFGRSVPYSAKRTLDFVRWLRDEDPDVLVTDDMFAVVAATMTETPFFVVSHNSMSLYDSVIDEWMTWGINRYQQAFAEEFMYPAVWNATPDDPSPSRIRRIPPIALDGPDAESVPDDVGALLVPSFYSRHFDRLARDLRAAGHAVTRVGGDDWETAPSLLPWIRAADVVVCSGYSTVMEAAVAGTPCIIYPFTDEQHGVSRKIERTGVPGFQVEHSIPHVVRAVDKPPERPEFENGTETVAERVSGFFD